MTTIIEKALAGDRGDDQRRIAELGLAWVEKLLRKNMDYGSSVFQVPCLAPDCDPGAAIRVRMSDKINRIKSLINTSPEVAGESLDDTVDDLGAYCLLWRCRPM